MEIGRIVRLFIPHFKKERYFLVYQIISKDYVLLNITDRDKRESINPIPQYLLVKKISPEIKSLINLNTRVFIEHGLLFELIEKAQENGNKQFPKISEPELKEINQGVDRCFSNEKFRGNRYEVRVL